MRPILVIDPDPNTHGLLTPLLTDLDYPIIWTATAADALARLQAVRPTMIITEFLLLNGSGPAYVRRLRELTLAAPVIVYTIWYEAEQAAIAAGASAFVPKSGVRLLRAAIAAALLDAAQ